MGMYCCCGVKISDDDYECTCDWDGWISTCDWPPERKNKNIPVSAPSTDGSYLVRYQSDGDRYEDIKKFSLTPLIEMGGYFAPMVPYEIHWEGMHWEDTQPYAWKEIE